MKKFEVIANAKNKEKDTSSHPSNSKFYFFIFAGNKHTPEAQISDISKEKIILKPDTYNTVQFKSHEPTRRSIMMKDTSLSREAANVNLSF